MIAIQSTYQHCLTELVESNVSGLFSETLTTQVNTVLSD